MNIAEWVEDYWCHTEGRVIVCVPDVWEAIKNSENRWCVNENEEKIEVDRYSNYMKLIDRPEPESLMGYMGTPILFVLPRNINPYCLEVAMGNTEGHVLIV